METIARLLALRSQGRSEIELCGIDGVFSDMEKSGAGTVCQTTTRGEKRVR